MKDVIAKLGTQGQLNLYDARTGGFVRSLNTSVGKYTSAVVLGAIVQATRKDGKVDTYDTETGRFIRTI